MNDEDAADPAATLENFEKAREIRERLAAADPTNASAQRDLWVSYNALADVLGVVPILVRKTVHR